MTRKGTWTAAGALAQTVDMAKGGDVADDVTTCSECDGTGWERIPGKERTVRHCQSCDYWDRRRGVAPGVPEDERGATLENYEPNGFNLAAIQHAGLFVQGVHQGLFIHGPVGTGKTRLACSILNDIWKAKTARVRFIRVPELLVRLQPSHSTEDESDNLIADLSEVPVLVLDDVGANAGTDFSRRMLQILVDARADRGNRTVWTSNLDTDELAEFLGDSRVSSRIVGSCRIVELGGPDQRRTRKPRTTIPPKAKPGGSRW